MAFPSQAWLAPQSLGLGLVGLLAGAAVGALIAGLVARARRAALHARMDWIEADRDEHRESLERAHAELARARSEQARLSERLDAEQRHAADKLATLTDARAQLSDQFRALSQEVLDEKTKAFDASTKASLAPLIDPLREHIGRFEKQVREAYDTENRQRSALAQQIRMLEASNRSIAEDATNLANALRGESKAQGNWGEMILETVLERSGLEKDTQYVTQFAATTEDGRRQLPDAVVHLPGERSLVIDSKVSLTAYLRVQEASDEASRQAALADHIASVRRHLKQLSAKNYQGIEAIRTLDYVFMFIPSEAAYVEALRGDFGLQREALEANIALVSPTTLMPMLRAVENLWRLDKQEKNAEAIAARAGVLYDKFAGFVADLDKVSRNLETVNNSMAEARNKLTDGRGNLVRQAEMLREMGANASKSLPDDWRDRAELGEQRIGRAAEDTPRATDRNEETP
ncbi:DNA recombination protein RmuC [Salinisphaera sp. Q1T1-3]|uniref:DNA recombination protein RmuC n=1 Tax=Salinisphaera sp. Q1T1-3 TaxID=2321229 RepID=UPI000E74A138|nr:DNA recombination protein RmuC [Salinisphaera sp. Q1T1-3]RJS91193.1 DNA recombination protein RmuC [Salinisphaera sp. Q1T1-3]